MARDLFPPGGRPGQPASLVQPGEPPPGGPAPMSFAGPGGLTD